MLIKYQNSEPSKTLAHTKFQLGLSPSFSQPLQKLTSWGTLRQPPRTLGGSGNEYSRWVTSYKALFTDPLYTEISQETITQCFLTKRNTSHEQFFLHNEMQIALCRSVYSAKTNYVWERVCFSQVPWHLLVQREIERSVSGT